MIPSKKELSERDICTKFITHTIKNAGWNTDTQMLEEVFFTDGKITVRGNFTSRGTRKRVDYILYYKPNIPIAVIEATANKNNNGDSIQQASFKSCNLRLFVNMLHLLSNQFFQAQHLISQTSSNHKI